MLGNLRETLAPLKTKVATPLARAGISPNLVSFMAVPTSALAAYLLVYNHPLLAFVVGVSSSLFDFIDGEVARLQNRASAFGNYFEAMVDRMVETILMVGLAYFFPVLAASALGLSLLVSYAKPRVGLVIVTDNRDWPGVGDHSDRMVLILGGYLFLPWGLAHYWLGALIALCLVGFIQRLLYARKLIDEAERDGNLLPYISADH